MIGYGDVVAVLATTRADLLIDATVLAAAGTGFLSFHFHFLFWRSHAPEQPSALPIAELQGRTMTAPDIFVNGSQSKMQQLLED